MPGKLALASVLALLPFLPLSPTPAPDLNLLATILAGPPDSSWMEARPASDTLEGTFGAAFYVNTEWSEQSDRDAIRNELIADRFIGGYARTFTKTSPDAYITEDVKAFPDAAHAMANWQWAMSYFHDLSDTVNNVVTPSIPNSFGERYVLDPWHGIDIYFVKANYVFTVTVGGGTDYLPDVATGQATSVYDLAPSKNVFEGSPKPAAAVMPQTPAIALAAAIGFIVVVAAVAVALVLVYATRRRPAPVTQTMLSPDGNFWWDGAQWQPVTRR